MDPGELLSRLHCPFGVHDLDKKEHDALDFAMAYVCDDGTSFGHHVGAFFEEHAETFSGLRGDVCSAEHSLVFSAIHEEFKRLTESCLSGFLSKHGFSDKDLYDECSKAISRADENFRHTPKSFFVQLLVACTEYEAFARMMQRAAGVGSLLLEELSDLRATAENALEDLRIFNSSSGGGAERQEEKSPQILDDLKEACDDALAFLDSEETKLCSIEDVSEMIERIETLSQEFSCFQKRREGRKK